MKIIIKIKYTQKYKYDHKNKINIKIKIGIKENTIGSIQIKYDRIGLNEK